MKRKPRFRPKASAAALIAIWALPVAAHAQNKPKFAPGEIICYCQPGTPQATVTALAAQVNAAAVTPLLLPDCYDFVLPAAQHTVADTLNGIATLKSQPGVRGAVPNLYFYPTQATTGVPTTTPNDPHYVNGDQWALPLINMPEAWVLQKGQPNVNLCDIDSCFDPTHPDLIGQYLPDSYDFANNDTNLGPISAAGEDQHGVFTSSLMVALTNNGIGMAAECWQGAKCLAFRTQQATGQDDLGTAIINSQMQVIADMAKDHIVAVNESFGADYTGTGVTPGGPGDPFFAAEKAMSAAGLIVCVSAGNSSENDSNFGPAAYVLPLHLTVSAVNRKGLLASYSNTGLIHVAAPGGEVTGPTDGVLGAGTFGADYGISSGGYTFAQGTSAAAPYVTALATLMMSVPGVTAQQAVNIIEQTANHTITGQTSVPDTNYGYGLIDAYQALLKVSYSATILNPVGINPATGQSTAIGGGAAPPVETLRPLFQFQVSNIPLSNVNITLQQPDGTTVQIFTNGVPNATLINQGILSDGVNPPGPANPGFTISGVSTGATAQFTLAFRYRFDQLTASTQETIQITAQPLNTTVPAVTDARTFSVAPHQFPTGLNLVAIPYYETAIDSPSGTLRDIRTILSAPDAVLYRWVTAAASGSTPAVAAYASNGTSSDLLPADATLYPADMVTTTDDGTDVRPIGIGYFLKTAEGTLVATYGQPATNKVNQNVHIPLREGWNMIGDPYSFEVAFSSTQIQTPDGNRQSITAAVTTSNSTGRQLLLPYIYNYAGGEYQFNQLPGGSLEPWQGHWIYVVPQTAGILNPKYTLTLIVPPTGAYSIYQSKAAAATRSASTARVSGTGSWSLQLAVNGGGLKDTQNFIGVSATATDGQDNTKAPKPPLMSPYVSLGMSRANGALYTQDLRALGHTETWNVVVSSDQKNAELTVTWPNITQVTRSTRLTLTDTVTGQTINMRSTSSYSFKSSANAGARQFTITATPGAEVGHAVLSSLFVNPSPTGRGVAGGVYQVSYNLSRAAAVDVIVMGPTGRTIAVPQPTRDISEGANTLVWNGHDSQGRAVPAGPYTLQVRATTPEGDVTRRIVSVVVTR